MKVGDLVTTIRHLPGTPISAIRGGALALIVGFDADAEAELSPSLEVRGIGRLSYDPARRILASDQDLDREPVDVWDPGSEVEVELLLAQLTDGEPSGRELSIFRFLASRSDAPEVLDICRLVARGEAIIQGLEVGRRDRFLGAAALIAAGKDDGAYAALRAAFKDQDVGKDAFLTEAATPTAESKARYWEQYLQLGEPPQAPHARFAVEALAAPRQAQLEHRVEGRVVVQDQGASGLVGKLHQVQNHHLHHHYLQCLVLILVVLRNKWCIHNYYEVLLHHQGQLHC